MTDRLIGLPEGRARNHNRPQQVPALMAVFIEDVAVGAEHTLALSSTGDVYGWGSNSEGQVCDNYGVNKLIMFPIFHWFMYYLNNSMDIYHFVVLYFLLAGLGPHQPCQRADPHQCFTRQKHPADICRSLPQYSMDCTACATTSSWYRHIHTGYYTHYTH